MSRRAFVGSSGTYNVRASELAREKRVKTIRCTVFFLDDSQQTFEIDKRSKGQILLDMVFQHLELIEKDYFGLQFSELDHSSNTMRWMDANKLIRKQIKSGPPYLLYFRVKFYVCDPSKLHEEYTRYHFFLQLKKDIVDGKLIVPSATAVLLASYAVQSEIGDFNPEEHKNGYLSELRLMANQTEEIEKKIAELHKLHKGQTPADAEYNFLDHAKRLDMYGVDLHKARDTTNADIQLGVTSSGLVVFQNNLKINTFSWAKIVKISFKRKQFFIQLRREGTETYDSLLGFNMLSYRSCKNLWKSCVEHHTFFRLHVPRAPTKRLLFSLGSKFRYSGRTEYQTLEDGKHKARTERVFTRSPTKRFARQTIPQVTREVLDGWEKKITKPIARINGTSNAHIRPYDSFSHKIQVSEPEYKPRKAWAETPSPEITAFTPSIPPKLLNYVDDDNVTDDLYEMSSYMSETVVANGHEESQGLATIKMKPDDQGRFGFNVKGGADQNLPILVSRVAPNTPADTCIPRLTEGDQVLMINGRDVAGLTHDQVVKLIRASRDRHPAELVLTVRPNVYAGEDVEEPDFQYIPDADHVSSKVPRSDVLAESMLLLSDGLESGAAIARFDQLYRKKPGMSMNIAKLPENLNKNRYKDISPYDSTRVILHGGSNGDYINASHVNMEIPTSGIVNRYIACQGPLPNTTMNFWLMVWEQQSTLVVMVTTLMERGRSKCHKYWPNLYDTLELGPLRVTCIREQEKSSFVFREFTLINNDVSNFLTLKVFEYMI
ncbi:tyrosine-protein phosphatase non-receptor type 4 [Parasteatoda tepidariorum]|uniref:tyrosine-protein phosphatase non-receptor type 4 n=1 Tax=Parasteatoda tepidariorum TaxID=114398 RepID=UPI0039BC290E